MSVLWIRETNKYINDKNVLKHNGLQRQVPKEKDCIKNLIK